MALGNFGGGDGTANDPYLVEDRADFEAMEPEGMQAKHYKQAGDIDFGETPFTPLGWRIAESFEGVYDGDGYKITGLVIENSENENTGLWAAIMYEAVFKNLTLENVQIEGGNNTGAFCGQLGGTIQNCFVTGTIKGAGKVGSLAGCNSLGQSTILDSHSSADLTGDNAVGGIMGDSSAQSVTERCYFSGSITLTDDQPEPDYGAILGKRDMYSSVLVSDCYYDEDLFGDHSTLGEGLRTEALKKKESFVGWDFDTVWDQYFTVLGGQPFLRSAKAYAVIDVSSAEELSDISSNLSGRYRQIQEIDLQGAYFAPIGSGSDFAGSYDGNGFEIRNLSIASSSGEPCGLFSVLKEAHLTRVVLQDAEIEGGNDVGGLAGSVESGSTIRNSRFEGTVRGQTNVGMIAGTIEESSLENIKAVGQVSGKGSVSGITSHLSNSSLSFCQVYGAVFAENDYAGGLVGHATNGSRIQNSFNQASVEAEKEGYAGGIIGLASSDDGGVHVLNCYTQGDVSGANYIGGACGLASTWEKSICFESCYSSGRVTATDAGYIYVGGFSGLGVEDGMYINCYYDSESSGQSDNDGRGMPKNTTWLQSSGAITPEEKRLSIIHEMTKQKEITWPETIHWEGGEIPTHPQADETAIYDFRVLVFATGKEIWFGKKSQ